MDDDRCEMCGNPMDIDSETDCDRCGMSGCPSCVRCWDDVIGYLCFTCEPPTAHHSQSGDAT